MQEKSRAFIDGRSNLDPAAQLFYMLPNNIHPHAASRDISDLFSSRESRFKDQLIDLFIGEIYVCLHQSSLNRFLKDFAGIQPSTIVRDADHNLAGLMLRKQSELGLRAFTCRNSFRRPFNTVVKSITNHVEQ